MLVHVPHYCGDRPASPSAEYTRLAAGSASSTRTGIVFHDRQFLAGSHGKFLGVVARSPTSTTSPGVIRRASREGISRSAATIARMSGMAPLHPVAT